MRELLILIVLMTAVTALPRILPFLWLREETLSPRVKRWMEQVPYAALGALIFPGCMDSFPGQPLIPLAGLTAAIALYRWRGGLILPVLGAVAAVYILIG